MGKGKVTKKKVKFLFFFIFYLAKAVANGLTGSEDIDFHLFFADAEDVGNVPIALLLHVTQLHTATLLLGQAVDEPAHQLDAIALYELVFG